jgi:integrase
LVSLKTVSARRSIAMSPELVLELKKWRLACPKGGRELVFCNRNGSALFESNVYSQGLRPALRRAGLREITLHELRHGFGSILISAGVSIKTVQVAMGHSSPSVTLQVYTHMLPGDGETVARAMSANVFGAGGTGNFSGTSGAKAQENGAAAGINT